MDTLLVIGALLVAGLFISMYVKHRSKNVPMDHKAPNVHNVQMKGKVGPATAADKPVPAAKTAKKTTKKKTTKKKTTKKTSKKVAAKKAEK